MTFIFFARLAGWSSATRAKAIRASPPAPVAPTPEPMGADSVAAQAQALDRHTAWPTHRIRCFLDAQRGCGHRGKDRDAGHRS